MVVGVQKRQMSRCWSLRSGGIPLLMGKRTAKHCSVFIGNQQMTIYVESQGRGIFRTERTNLQQIIMPWQLHGGQKRKCLYYLRGRSSHFVYQLPELCTLLMGSCQTNEKQQSCPEVQTISFSTPFPFLFLINKWWVISWSSRIWFWRTLQKTSFLMESFSFLLPHRCLQWDFFPWRTSPCKTISTLSGLSQKMSGI